MNSHVFFRLRHLRHIACIVCLPVLLCASAMASAQPPAALQTEAERLAALVPGRVGAALVHLESGRAVYLDADTPYPMASTVKIPVAVHILKLVDEGVLSLQQQITLGADDVYPQMGGPMDRHQVQQSACVILST